MQFDTASDQSFLSGMDIAAISSDTTTNGEIIDTQDFNALTFVMMVGTRTDGTYTLKVQEGDESDLSDAADADASDLVGTLSDTAVSASNGLSKVGYVGNKRYVRASVVSTSVTTGATVGVVAVLGRPAIAPVA